MTDVPLAKNDCDEMRACFEKYNIKSEEQVYDLSENPTEEKVKNSLDDIKDKLVDGLKASPP